MTDEELREELTMARRVCHNARLQLAKFGIGAPPHMIIEAEDAERRIAELERALGIEQRVEFERQAGAEQEAARQADVAQQMKLLGIHRTNLAHYRAQARYHGSIEQSPPITRHGIDEARDGITRTKRALEALGVRVDDLPGDE